MAPRSDSSVPKYTKKEIDIEMQSSTDDKLSSGSASSIPVTDFYSIRHSGSQPVYGEDMELNDTRAQRFVNSFKRMPSHEMALQSPTSQIDGIPRNFSVTAASIGVANSPLARKLKGRHLQMIAIGGSIGTGLFVASGKALNTGGPASVIIAYSLIGMMLYCTVQALGELAVLFPVAGSFSSYSTRFLDPAWGFAMGWNYALQWLVVLPLEIIAASITIGYWNNNLNRAIFVTIFLIAIVGINLFGVKGYGEAEFLFSILKVIAVIGFILLGITINIGGGAGQGYIGGQYWVDPGAFNDGFKGLCSVFVLAAFAFGGTELVGLAAAEAENPRKSLPTAIKQVFWRITLFYILSLLIVTFNVGYNDQRLLTGGDAYAAASPFVIAIENAGIEVLPSVMNGVILIAILSVGNSSIFGSSRTLAALAAQGQAPRILGYIDRKGRPIIAILVASAFSLIAYTADLDAQGTILTWLLAISGLSSIFTWSSICLAHIRFRGAWIAHGNKYEDLPYKAQSGVLGSYIGFSFNILVLMAQFWTGIWPIGYESMTMAEQASNFFQYYLAAPIVLSCYLGYKFWYRTEYVTIEKMDLVTGRRDLDMPRLIAQEKLEQASWPTWKKWYKLFC